MASLPTFRVSGTCLASTIILNRINGKSDYNLGISSEIHHYDEMRNMHDKVTILRLNTKKKPVNWLESRL